MPGTNICRRTASKQIAKPGLLVLIFLITFFVVVAQQFDPKQLKTQNDAVDEFVRIKHGIIDSLNRQIAKGNDTTRVDCLISLYFQKLQLDSHAAFRNLEQAG